MKCHSKRLHCGLPVFRDRALLGLQAKAAPGLGALQNEVMLENACTGARRGGKKQESSFAAAPLPGIDRGFFFSLLSSQFAATALNCSSGTSVP